MSFLIKSRKLLRFGQMKSRTRSPRKREKAPFVTIRNTTGCAALSSLKSAWLISGSRSASCWPNQPSATSRPSRPSRSNLVPLQAAARAASWTRRNKRRIVPLQNQSTEPQLSRPAFQLGRDHPPFGWRPVLGPAFQKEFQSHFRHRIKWQCGTPGRTKAVQPLKNGKLKLSPLQVPDLQRRNPKK